MFFWIIVAYTLTGAFIGGITTYISARDPNNAVHRTETPLQSLSPEMYYLIVYMMGILVSAGFWPLSFPLWLKNFRKSVS